MGGEITVQNTFPVRVFLSTMSPKPLVCDPPCVIFKGFTSDPIDKDTNEFSIHCNEVIEMTHMDNDLQHFFKLFDISFCF